MIQIKREKAFRFIAIDLLKYLISAGRVTIPTAMTVETKAATCIYPAPALSNAPPRGNAIKLGINVMDPIIKAKIAPKAPDSGPIMPVINFWSKTARVMPTNNMIEKALGNNLMNDDHAMRALFFVLLLSFKNDRSNKVPAIKYRMYEVIVETLFQPLPKK
ncbi:MAG: hypothetical protein AB7E31_15115 [Desulfitobacterium sp.]